MNYLSTELIKVVESSREDTNVEVSCLKILQIVSKCCFHFKHNLNILFKLFSKNYIFFQKRQKERILEW